MAICGYSNIYLVEIFFEIDKMHSLLQKKKQLKIFISNGQIRVSKSLIIVYFLKKFYSWYSSLEDFCDVELCNLRISHVYL